MKPQRNIWSVFLKPARWWTLTPRKIWRSFFVSSQYSCHLPFVFFMCNALNFWQLLSVDLMKNKKKIQQIRWGVWHNWTKLLVNGSLLVFINSVQQHKLHIFPKLWPFFVIKNALPIYLWIYHTPKIDLILFTSFWGFFSSIENNFTSRPLDVLRHKSPSFLVISKIFTKLDKMLKYTLHNWIMRYQVNKKYVSIQPMQIGKEKYMLSILRSRVA